jgi:hypothetical protein
MGLGLFLLSSTLSWAGSDRGNTFGVDPGAGAGAGVTQSGSHASGGPTPGRVPAPNASPSIDSLSSNEQAAVYQRANENLITQTIYIETNVRNIKDTVTGLKGDDSDKNDPTKPEIKEEISRSTSGFCVADDNTDKNAVIDCLDQYREMRLGQLRDLRQQITENGDTLAQLQQELGSKKKNAPKRAPVYGSNIKSKMLPKVPTYQEFAKDYSSYAMKSYLPLDKKKDIEAFIDRTLRKPKPEDYYKTLEEDVDPSNPDAGTYRHILVDNSGKKVIDREAYQKAMAAYEKMLQVRAQEAKDAGTAASGTPNFKTRLVEKILSLRNGNPPAKTLSEALGNSNSLDDNKPQKCGEIDSGPRQDYCMARNLVVMYYNGEAPDQAAKQNAKAQKVGETNQPNRRTASAQSEYWQRPEDYKLKAETPNDDKNKETTESIYMPTSVIDQVLDNQFSQ